MTTNPQPETEAHWPVGFAIRPMVDPDAAAVEVSDTVTGRRFRWRPEALAEHILSRGAPPFPDDASNDVNREFLTSGWRHWHHRGWRPSDQSYVASRRWQYADTDDVGDGIRARTLEDYLQAGGGPPREVLPDGPGIPLGEPAPPGTRPVSELLASRRTGRAYVPKPASMTTLSGLLWHALADVRARRERTTAAEPLSFLDSFGSAWDFHICVYSVDGLEPGSYRYDIERHELRTVRLGDHRDAMIDVLQGMHSPATATWTIGLVADFPRYQWRYRHEHGLRRLWFESGAIGQELIVVGASYGLNTLVTPAQKDRPYLALHGLDDRRYASVYTLTMGLARRRDGADFNGTPIVQVRQSAGGS